MSDHLPPAVGPGLVEGLAALQKRGAQLQGELQRLRHAIGHDLRAPLRHITGFVQVIREDHGSTLSAEVQQHLDTIAVAAAQLRSTLDALLKDLPAAD